MKLRNADAMKDLQFPKVYDYMSPIPFLEDVYAYRKVKDKGFTYESWAEEMGFKSRAFLKIVIGGKRRITPKFTSVLKKSCQFSEKEANYFSLITAFSQSKEEADREIYLQKVLEVRGSIKKSIEVAPEEFLMSPYYPHVQTLLSFKDIKKSISTMSAFLGISEEQVNTALEQLQKLGLAQQDEDGNWNSSEPSFQVGIKFGSESIKNYHNSSAQQAIEAQNMDPALRRFRSLIFALSEEEFQDVLKYMDSFASRNLAKYDVDQIENRRLYKMNMNIFPISKKHSDQETEFSA